MRARPIAFACLFALLVATATAQAQDDPYLTVEEQAETSQIDTDQTPVAKDSELWSLIHGAPYPKTELVADSVTSFDTELRAVSFRNRTIGLAGGSACATTPIQEGGEEDSEFGRRADECTGASAPRVPVLYRYHEPQDEDPGWDRLPLPGDTEPGYVGAIAWIDSERALIVGGTGSYPERETAADGKAPTDPAKTDEAGDARAWLYDRAADEVTEEIDLSSFIPYSPERDGMRGLSAVGCYADPTPGRIWNSQGQLVPDPNPDIELCFAGGLGQIWEWRDDKFTGTRVDSLSPEAELKHAAEFRYRVREVEFLATEPPAAFAVTSGCCAADEAENVAKLLVYDDEPAHARGDFGWQPRPPEPPRWYARPLVNPVGDSAASVLHVGGPDTAPVNDATGHGNAIDVNPGLPDSFYSLTTAGETVSVLASPGAPESSSEPPSVIRRTYYHQVKPGGRQRGLDQLRIPLSTARLLSGDGNIASGDSGRLSAADRPLDTSSEAVPDWVVGELRSTERPSLGTQGLVVATALQPPATAAINEGRGATPPNPQEVTEGDYQPFDQETLDAYARSSHYLLPSYTAHAIDIVGAQEDGWAVGDHGAILRLSEKQVSAAEGASEPQPPKLGSARSAPLSDRSDYPREQLPSKAGVVPGLDNETIPLDERQMIPAGSPGPGSIKQIVMSRDASQGWAIGQDGAGATLTHFDGTAWRRCDPLGVEGVAEPDPACEALAGLRGWRDASGDLLTTSLDHIARVPLEYDSDPTNDDELEIVAIGGFYRGPEYDGRTLRAFVRYRDGRWQFEEPRAAATIPAAIVDMAFAGIGEGWAVRRNADGKGADLFRFDGQTWTECIPGSGSCGDRDGRLPTLIAEVAGLTTAGERIYLYGNRRVGRTAAGECATAFIVPVCTTRAVPLILYRDPGGEWTDGSGEGEDHGGFDPGFADPATRASGYVESLSVVESPEGGLEGWATGKFDGVESPVPLKEDLLPPQAALMHLDPGTEDGWRVFRSPGALEDYMTPVISGRQAAPSAERLQVTYPSELEPDGAYIGQIHESLAPGNRIFGFDSARGRFKMLQSGRPQGNIFLELSNRAHPDGDLTAMAPDGDGGFWAAVSGSFYHYTDRAPKQVFTEVASPLAANGNPELRDLTGGPDGSVWIATDSDRLFRHDRLGGWEQARIPGWDPGRVVTRASAANAIAIGPGGEGIVVGEGGRIANVSAGSVSLDPAAGRSCALGAPAPCSTSRDLLAADVAPNGAAIAAGNRMSLLWRPSGGAFQAIDKPKIGSSTQILAVSYPTPTTAYLLTSAGIVFRGQLSGDAWSWRTDNAGADGELTTLDDRGGPALLFDLAVDAAGHGYAVGASGLVFERSGQGAWRRLVSPTPEPLRTVELSPSGESALLGGPDGLILSAVGAQIAVSRQGDAGGNAAGFAYLPGSSEGSLDAWAATAGGVGEGGARLFRHRSDPADARLEPTTGLAALADTPPEQDGELSLAAFGKSDCEIEEQHLCPEMSATTTTNEVVTQRIVDELGERRESGELDLAVLSGDATDSAGRHGSSLGDFDKISDGPFLSGGPSVAMAGQLKHRRFAELVGDELEDEGVALYGAIGGQDLTETTVCTLEPPCETTKQYANAGENLAWREAFGGERAPWGSGEDALELETGELELEPAPGSEDNSLRIEDQSADPDGDGSVPEAKAAIGGASTHYALDALRDGEPIARIVFVDTSLRSLQASDPLQQPHELAGGQTRFLERMICREGETTTFGDACTREPGQEAIVVSNTPTYSYGPGALSHTALDATTFEALMLKHRVDLVISGALGYNGLYYTLAPGIHEPCPAGAYPEAPPSASTPDCLSDSAAATDALEEHAPEGTPDPASLVEEQGLSGAYPTLIASGAGGKFGPDGNEPPDGPAGQWHGYSIARLLPNGDLVVEQRPILDWIGLDAPDHAVAPRSRLKLNGYARSPISTTTEAARSRAFAYEISNAAITHRYDLLLADPDEPWVPCRADDVGCGELHANLAGADDAGVDLVPPSNSDNPCAPYLCLPQRIGTIDDQSGQIRAGDGKYPETFAVAMLSVKDRVATYPLVFKRSPAFVTSPSIRTGALPKLSGARPGAPPPPPPPPGLPQIPQVEIPQIPPPPGIPQLTAATPPELQPPAPPAPPPPSQQPTPLDLSVSPPGVSISTPTALIQPPTPPVNPAPPGGARREARQRQAAAQKGGADSSESEQEGLQGDLAGDRAGPEASPMTRHSSDATRRDRVRAAPSFTTLSAADQPSAWSRGALYGGGLTLAAALAAIGFSVLRPTPRRRETRAPAPAFSKLRR